MLTLFHQDFYSTRYAEQDLNQKNWPNINEEIEKTRIALEIAYAGFNYATEEDVIDCYIYEINSLLKRYGHLDALKKQVVSAAPVLP